MAAPVASVRSPLPEVRRPPRRRRWRPGVVTAVLIVAALTLMLLDVRGGPTELLRAAGAAVGGPLESASSGLLRALPDQVRRPDAAALLQEVARLQKENERLAMTNQLLADQFAAVTGERALAAYAGTLAQATVSARVVGATSPPAHAAVTIDVGSDAGVAPDSAVLVPGGLVGRVVEVGPVTSTVQLVTSPDSGVAVRLSRSRQTGLVQGTGDSHELALRHVDALADVRTGDTVVTLGSPGDRPFPPGLTVGTLSDVGSAGDVNRRIQVTPAVDVGTLDRVVVLAASRASIGSDPSTGSSPSTGPGTEVGSAPDPGRDAGEDGQ